jgi:hypothetical protein
MYPVGFSPSSMQQLGTVRSQAAFFPMLGEFAERRGLRALPAAGSEVSRPTEESHQLSPFLPQEEPEKPGVDSVSFAAGIGFDTPLEVFAAPWGEPMPSCRIPQKADRHAKAPLYKVYPSGEVTTAWG